MQQSMDAEARAAMPPPVRLGPILAGVISLALVCACVSVSGPHVLMERLLNQSPQARLGERRLTILREGAPPTDLPAEQAEIRLGLARARKYVRRDADGMLREVVVLPVEEGGPAGAAIYTLGGLPEDEDYARLFDTLLRTIELVTQLQAPA